jgi:PAS domain S-box-containing protein
LKRIRAHPDLCHTPFLLLSARAGEQSAIEGLSAGADDYICKPFSARELVTRISCIVERARVEEALRASQDKLSKFLSATSDKIYELSADWREMHPLKGNLLVASTEDSLVDWIEKDIPEGERERVLAAMEHAIVNGSVFKSEHRVIRDDGTIGWTFSRVVPLLNNSGEVIRWFGADSDISERKRTEQALRESEEKYRTLFELMDEGFCIVEMIFDSDGKALDYRFIEMNSAFVKQTGLVDALNRTMRELVPEHEEFWFRTYGEVARTGQPRRFEQQAEAMNRWFDVYAFRIGRPEANRVAILFTDITERKRNAAKSEGLAKTDGGNFGSAD